MIRTIITALLLIGLAGSLDHTLPQILLGYAVVVAAALWLTWPLLRILGRGLRRLRRRRRLTTPAPTAPQLTQINHHHYYAPTPAAPQMPHRPDRTLPALPQQTLLQRESTSIHDILDLDDEGPHR